MWDRYLNIKHDSDNTDTSMFEILKMIKNLKHWIYNVNSAKLIITYNSKNQIA